MSAGKRRHIVNILRPTAALGPDGQPQGQDTVWLSAVPCSIEAIAGSEPEVGGQQIATTTYRVEMYGDPEKPLKHSDYLMFGTRRLNINQIDDLHQNGQQLTLICGEHHDP